MKTEFVRCIDSTNSCLYSRGLSGESDDCALLSFEQTNGRGRSGRNFFSPKDTGLYLSLLLHPKAPVSECTKLTTMMAVAVALSLEELKSPSISIKWVNDLYIGSRKVAGILTECSPQIVNGIPSFVVCGVGVNVYAPDGGFPQDIENRAGYVFDRTDEDIRRKLASKIIENFEELYHNREQCDYFDEYEKRLFILGQTVNILNGPKVKVLSLNRDYSLKVLFDDGHTEDLSSGEVSLIL